MRQGGFTILEILVAIAIIGVMVGISLPVLQSFQTRNDLDLTTQSIVYMLRRAQANSRAVNGDSQWGVAVQSTSAILFKGATFAGRDSSFDETISIPANIAPSGISEVEYSKLAAAPNATGTITLTANLTNDSKVITINAKGMVDY